MDSVILMLTPECNQKCKFCMNSSVSGLISDWKRRIGDVKQVVLSGGEPLLYDGLFDLIDYCHSNGKYTVLQTNGTLIDEAFCVCNKAKVDLVQVSVEGVRCMHNHLTNGDYDKTVAGIRLLKKYGFRVRVSFTIMKKNMGCFAQFVRFMKKLGVEGIDLIQFYPVGRGEVNKLELMPSYEDLELFLKLHSSQFGYVDLQGCFSRKMLEEIGLEKYWSPCSANATEVAIRWDGKVIPCPAWPESKATANICVESCSLTEN